MNKHCLAGFANQGGLHTSISTGISFAAKNKRPDAVIVTKSGQTISLDVTGCHAEVAGQPLKGVEDASTAKHVMYDGLCQQEGSRLVAVSVDHLGGHTQETLDFVNLVAASVSERYLSGTCVWDETSRMGEECVQCNGS